METIVLDLDGTLLEHAWPDVGNWMPGAIEGVKRLHDAGYHLVIDSSRFHTMEFGTAYINHKKRDPAARQAEINFIREMLDNAGLRYVEIYTDHGKPPASYYIDDRAERYMGHANSWTKVVDKILVREGKLDPE